ncbi:response regulator transcription factor [Fusibacter sp. 3D3]|uniref:response regulator transcription factor n=1 Tax=Fusibacter sp. 3D3 TaxID=1048380 RepID=UPI00085371A1|nr:response regulator transcription factor [Fusibacter sp. 3D3]GAU78289.1 phosphate regulon transcriptional regulatory protein PhoB [Fusibacter sp. 3D3]
MNVKTGKGKLILLVEDNEKIMRGNQRLFGLEGFETMAALTLCAARTSIVARKPDAVILDIMLPDGSGLDFMQELRTGEHTGIPILLLTGLTTPEDIIRGLTAGGDDYLTKPYDFSILLARVEALLRRAQRVPETITKDRFTLDMTASVAMLDGVDLLLTQKEFALLLIFIQNPVRFIDGEYLYEKVWHKPQMADANALKSTIKRLRSKMEGSGWQISWSRGEGYCLEKE